MSKPASLVVVDVEADGPFPPKYSMVCFGAIVVEPSLTKTFYGQTKPISSDWLPKSLSISGFTRAQHETFDEPKEVMEKFREWLSANFSRQAVFISDNPAFDWTWINYYFHAYLGGNPFGYSARRIGDLYCGMKMNLNCNAEWKKLYRQTKHDHNPLHDAKGNAEALLAFQQLGLKFND